MLVVKKHLTVHGTTADQCTEGRSPFVWCVFQTENKMASRRSYTREEVVDELFADPDSDFDEQCSSESEEEYSSDKSSSDNEEIENSSESDEANGDNNEEPRGRGRGRGRGAPRRNRAAGHGARIDRQQQDALLELQWTSNDQEPQIHPFTARSGIQVQLPNNAGAGDYLSLFLTDEFYDLLVVQTNLYAAQFKRDNPNLPPNSRATAWIETTRNEMKKFLALALLMGIVRKPEVSDYWSTNPLLKGSIFNNVMPRNRFQSILQFLHFAGNSNYDATDPNHDRLYKVRPVIEYLVSKFKSNYIPEQHISIDEELLLWKGRLVFKQYIPLKRARFGIKMFSLCETTGYLWNSYVYLGKEPDAATADPQMVRRLGKSGAVIPRLMQDLLGKGYKLFVDNWYTSEELFSYLYENETTACGTARKNRLRLPASLKTTRLAKGEHAFRRKDNMLAVRLNDKKKVATYQ